MPHSIHCFCEICRIIDPDSREHCVICNKPTEYLKRTPIAERDDYIEGVGQMCKECAKRNRSCGI